jgi:hypothetical protein
MPLQWNTKARVAALVATVLALGLAVHCAGILDVPAPEDPPLGPGEAGGAHGSRLHAPSAAGVQARAIDPAKARLGWTSTNVDPALLAAALRRPLWGSEASMLDLQANADMVPWLQGFAGDDEFGQAIAECRRRHERSQPSPCVREQDVVVRRSPQGEASVVAALPRIHPDDHFDGAEEPPSTECRAWAQCIAHAWEGRPARFPQGAGDRMTTGDDGSELIAIRTDVSDMLHLDVQGTDLAAYLATYEDRIERLDEKIRMREQAYVDAEEQGVRSRAALEGLFHNLLLDRGKLEDARAYLRYLYAHEGGS